MLNRVLITFLLLVTLVAEAATFTVLNTNDSGPGSLRQALTEANAAFGVDTIAFNVPGTGPQVIALLSSLPQIDEAVTIDATTQPGYSGLPLIALNGTGAGSNAFGLLILDSGCTVRGLAIYNFSRDGIRIEGESNNTIQGNHLGIDASGNVAAGMGENGIGVFAGGQNIIGGTNTADRNIIGACGLNGIIIVGEVSANNRVLGNFIGVGLNGTNRLGNIQNGVELSNAPSNFIGDDASGGNVISGNFQSGVFLLGNGATNNVIAGNRIGTDPQGRIGVTNAEDGITIANAGRNRIGGTAPGARNLISGNDQHGIYLRGPEATGNVVEGNFIGTDLAGAARMANGAGIGIEDAPANFLGGAELGSRNLISGNLEQGIYIVGITSAFNRVEGNYIGCDVSGTRALANDFQGVFVSAPSNYIGSAVCGAGNLISGNGNRGINLSDAGCNGNVVQGNFIGTQADGLSPLGNYYHGIEIEFDASFNRIGGTGKGEGNRIAFAKLDGYDGIRIQNNGVGVGNLVRGNAIFGNAGLGIDLGTNGVTLNDVGDADDGPNRLQNFPVLNSASGRFKTVIQGTLNSRPSQTYQMDFFANTLVETNGHGEGQTWLGSRAVSTDVSGNGAFTATFTNTFAVTGVIAATATDAEGNTSEFSAHVTNQVPALIDTDSDGLPDDYETAWGFNPGSAADAQADADGDGASNLAEYLAGTNPWLAGDNLRFLAPPRRTTGGTLLVFNPAPGKSHRVEYTGQVAGPWQVLATNLISFGCPVRVTDSATVSSNRFYRLLAQ